MNIDASFLMYFWNAGVVVKLVLLLLVSASIASWTCILQRAFYLKDASRAAARFEEAFWSGSELSAIYNRISRQNGGVRGLEAIFCAGFKEFVRFNNKMGVTPVAIMESVKRAMRGCQMREQERLERYLSLLATVGSTSPYVGLFGTVWGIMLSFRALAHVQQATIAMVAPGIAEALIATAMGLFAAIPAVIAYNRYMSEVNHLLNRFDVFQDEFSNILFRQAQQHLVKHESAVVTEL